MLMIVRRILANFPVWLLIVDALMITLAWLLAFSFRILTTPHIDLGITWQHFFAITFLLLPVWLGLFAVFGLYSKKVYERGSSELIHIFVGSFLGILLMIGADFFMDQAIFLSRLLVIYGYLAILVLLVLGRVFLRSLRILLYGYSVGLERVLVVGDNSKARILIHRFLSQNNASGFELVGFVGNPDKLGFELPASVKRYTKISHIPYNKLRLDAIIAVGNSGEVIEKLSRKSFKHYIQLRIIPRDSNIFQTATTLEIFNTFPMLFVQQTRLDGWSRILKRFFDILSGICLLLAALPVLLLALVLIKATAWREPVFFKQKRVTKFEREVPVIKLRTMHHKYRGLSLEEALKQVKDPKLSKLHRSGKMTDKDDPRITRIGRLLRSTSIDELPQLINVIKGDISLVGPRAASREDFEGYEEYLPIFLSVKTGLTGLAQVHGRNNLSIEEKINYNVYYIKNWSLFLDFIIVLKTFYKVLKREGIDDYY